MRPFLAFLKIAAFLEQDSTTVPNFASLLFIPPEMSQVNRKVEDCKNPCYNWCQQAADYSFKRGIAVNRMDNQNSRMRKLLNRLIFILALAVFAVAVIKLLRIGWDYYSANQEYDGMQKFIRIAERTSDTGRTDETEQVGKSNVIIDFESLKRENQDCIGWIYFPGLEISYPIMQGEDNEEYLRRTFSGEYKTAASIFADSENASDFTDKHTLIYGHNMKNGAMFGQLKNYEEEVFFRENPGFFIETPEGSSYYSIFSCILAAVDGQEDAFQISFSSKEEYGKFLDSAKRDSLYDTGVMPDTEQNVVTLVTCNQAGADYRFIIHAVRSAGR